MTVLSPISLKIVPQQYYSLVSIIVPAQKLPKNTVLLFRLVVKYGGNLVFRTNFQEMTEFQVPTSEEGEYMVAAIARVFMRKDCVLDLQPLIKCAAAANELLKTDNLLVNGVFNVFKKVCNDYVVADCAQYTAAIVNINSSSKVMSEQVPDNVEDTFASGAKYFSVFAKQMFVVESNQEEKVVLNYPIYGINRYIFEEDDEIKRLRLIPLPLQQRNFYIYSKEYADQQTTGVFPSLNSGARVSHEIKNKALATPVIMRDIEPYSIKDERFKYAFKVINENSVAGKVKQSLFIIQSRENHVCISFSGEGLINFEMPLYEEQIKITIRDKKELKTPFFEKTEWFRAIQQNIELKSSFHNCYFFTSIGFFDSESEIIDTSFFKQKLDYSNYDTAKLLKKGVLKQDYSFGIVNCAGDLLSYNSLQSLVLQAERNAFTQDITRIVDGLCIEEENNASFLLLCETGVEAKQYILMAILYTGELMKIFPLCLTNLFRNEKILQNPNEPVIAIRAIDSNTVLLVFEYILLLFNFETGKIEWQFSNENSVITSSFKKQISAKLTAPSLQKEKKYSTQDRIESEDPSASTNSEIDISLTSDFLPTSETENSDELVVASDIVESDSIMLAYAPQFIPIETERLAFSIIKENSQIGRILDAQIFRFRKQSFIYLLQKKELGVYGVWWNLNATRKIVTMVGCVGISREGDEGNMVQQVDSVIFSVKQKGKTIVKEYGLFGEQRREYVFQGEYSIIEVCEGLESKITQEDWN